MACHSITLNVGPEVTVNSPLVPPIKKDDPQIPGPLTQAELVALFNVARKAGLARTEKARFEKGAQLHPQLLLLFMLVAFTGG